MTVPVGFVEVKIGVSGTVVSARLVEAHAKPGGPHRIDPPHVKDPEPLPPVIHLAAIPVPVSDTVCGLPVALSTTESVPVLVPTAVGVNVTLIVQNAPIARLVPQLLV